MRHTKIVATLGPATGTDEAIHELITAGVDVFRLNFSHGTRSSHGEIVTRVRAVADRLGRTVALLQDLAGPKIRTGALRGGMPLPLHAGDELRLVAGDIVGEPGVVSTTYTPLLKALGPGDTLLLDDGTIELRVEDAGAGEARTRVVNGGVLGEHKGINAPGVDLPSGLTSKDVDDLRFGVAIGVDFVALSFVQRAADVRRAREVATEAGAPHLPLVAKLERPEAISHIDEILDAADAVMVARGDLGLELPFEQVPRVQKDIVRRARARGIPVIVATQVLESMRTQPRPTRAEVSDAANAVDAGVDAIMLAGETAAGQYPTRAVRTLDLIIRDAEAMPPVGPASLEVGSLLVGEHGRALCEAAVTLTERARASAIVAVTRGGKTARLLSALRPRAPIYAATNQLGVSRRLALAWGVVPVLTDLGGDVSEAASRIGEALVERGAIPRGSVAVLVSITPDLGRGPSNFLKLQRV